MTRQQKQNPEIGRRLGAVVRACRIQKGMTQDELAVAIGVATNTVSRIEQGIHVPSIERLDQIAKALGQPMGVLVGGASLETDDLLQDLQARLQNLDDDSRQFVVRQAVALADYFFESKKTGKGRLKKS